MMNNHLVVAKPQYANQSPKRFKKLSRGLTKVKRNLSMFWAGAYVQFGSCRWIRRPVSPNESSSS